MKDRAKWIRIVGWTLFLIAIGFFCLQMGFLFLHVRYQVEYIDNRIFYMINILLVACLAVALLVLLKLKNSHQVIIASIGVIFYLTNIVLLENSNQQIRNITSISPSLSKIFSVKENVQSGEAIYYRPYYGILARPKEVLENKINGNDKVKWLAKDVAVLTYKDKNGDIQQFVGTYGDRKGGLSYYYVGAEIHGVWQGDNVTVTSGPDGINVTVGNESELFSWENLEQFGTLAIVLKRDNEAAWTIALKENFEVHSDASKPTVGNISLYKAIMEENQPVILNYIDSN